MAYRILSGEEAAERARKPNLNQDDVFRLLGEGEYERFPFADDCDIDESGIRAKPLSDAVRRTFSAEERAHFERNRLELELAFPCSPAELLAWCERNGFDDLLPPPFVAVVKAASNPQCPTKALFTPQQEPETNPPSISTSSHFKAAKLSDEHSECTVGQFFPQWATCCQRSDECPYEGFRKLMDWGVTVKAGSAGTVGEDRKFDPADVRVGFIEARKTAKESGGDGLSSTPVEVSRYGERGMPLARFWLNRDNVLAVFEKYGIHDFVWPADGPPGFVRPADRAEDMERFIHDEESSSDLEPKPKPAESHGVHICGDHFIRYFPSGKNPPQGSECLTVTELLEVLGKAHAPKDRYETFRWLVESGLIGLSPENRNISLLPLAKAQPEEMDTLSVNYLVSVFDLERTYWLAGRNQFPWRDSEGQVVWTPMAEQSSPKEIEDYGDMFSRESGQYPAHDLKKFRKSVSCKDVICTHEPCDSVVNEPFVWVMVELIRNGGHTVDWDHWAKLPRWTAKEAAALIYSVDPLHVENSIPAESCFQDIPLDGLRDRITKLTQYAERTLGNATPTEWLQWAGEYGLSEEIHPRLKALVQATRGTPNTAGNKQELGDDRQLGGNWTNPKDDDEKSQTDLPTGRRDLQIQIILKVAAELEYDSKCIPSGGKAKIERRCLENGKLFSKHSFKKAWQEARNRNLIEIEDIEKYRSTNGGHYSYKCRFFISLLWAPPRVSSWA